MSSVCALAGETKVETPEGPMALRSVVGKMVPVFSRDPNGRVRFRPMLDVRPIEGPRAVIRVVLDNGLSFLAGEEQRVFPIDGEPIPVRDLTPGTVLLSAFHYPRGYRFRRADGNEEVSAGGWRVVHLERQGEAQVFSLRVPPEDCFFVTAGVLCQSEPSPR